MRILLALSLPATAFAVADACDLFGRIEGDIGADAGDVTVPGTTKKDWVGHSISATADLNGDGIADVVVSAHGDDTNGLNSGAVHVFYGPVNTGALDLALADVSMYGPSFGVKAGYAVSSAGDVDGDGFDDLLIGSLPSGNSAYKEGVAWLVRGSASLSGAVDLATQADATFEGPGVDYEFGSVVASAGDLNGDGNIDIAIGAPKDDTAADNAGAVYVFYSPALGSQSAASADLIITGDASVERVGLSLHSPGDVDGDGLDDLLIGAPRNDVNGTNSGTAYVWAGDATLSGTVGISGSMAALRGNFGNRAGSSLGSAGDVDNDGLADFWVGSKQFGGGKRGAAYLVSGADAVGDLLLPDIYEARLKGEGSSDLLGSSIFGNVDFDADGDMDVIVGAERADGGAIQSGAAYVVHGPFFGDIVVDPAVDGKISGYAYLDFTGGAVGAGDVNNDGFVDALVGSWKTEIAGPRDSGHVSIVFGGEDVQDEITWYADTDFDGYGDEKVTQISCDQPTGYVDVGGDCDDSSALFNPGIIESDCGSTIDYNCDGSVGLTDADGDGVAACEGDCDDDDDQRSPLLDELCFDDIDNDCDGLTDDGSAVDAVLWYPDSDNDSYGNDLAGVSSCEVPEFFIGAVVNTGGDCDDFNDDINPEANEVCDSVDNDCDGNIDGSDAIDALAWYPDADEDGYGDYASLIRDCVQPAGAVANAEDCDDTDAFTRPGAVEVCDGEDNDCDGLRYLGGPIAGAASFTDITSDVVNARLGQRVAFLADQNADGMGEIVAAAPDDSTNAQNAGVVYVMAGDFAGGTFEATGDFNDGSPRYMAAITTTRPTSELGAGLATGDFNNDGIADLAVGAPGMSRPRVDQGGVFVFFGPVMGDLDVEDADAIIGGPAQDSRMGQALATADLDGDGIDDLLVGAPGADGNGAESGVTYVFYGDALSGDLGAGDAAATLSGMAAGDGMGESVAVVGDVNNDGNVDIAAGAPYDSNSQAGYVDVVLGDGARFSGALSASFTLVGSSSNDSLGTSIAGMGDSNGDGFDDIALGSRDNSSYVWRGAASPASGDIESVGYARFDGALFASSGREVATAGDINRDGFADLLIGAHKDDEGADDAGAVYVVYGDNDWAGEEEATGLIAIELNDIESQGRLEEGTTEPTLSYTNANVPHGAKLMGDIIDGALGRGIAGNIDMNGDSFPDILAGEPGAFDDAGAARVFLAGPYGVDVVNTVAAGWSSGITVDGYATDWIGDIQFATSAGGDTRTAITWDDTNLYIGVEHPDVATGGAEHWVVAYIGNGDAGSTTGLLFNTQEPGLPFEATHAMRWKADDSYNGFATWDGAAWQEAANWLGTNGSEKAERNDESVAEFAIPLSEIGDPSTLSIVVHWVYEGAGFETSYAATPSFLYADASYDPDPAEYYAFNLAATTAPRFYGTLPSGGGIPGLEGTMTTYYADADLDGQVNAELLTFDACPLHVPMITDDDGNIIYGGVETTETATDCDDTDPTIYVGAPETANDGIDSDCDSFDNPNNIPVVTVNIEPNRPTTEDDLVAITNVTDADKGTPEETPINLTYTWTINGFEVPGQNSNTLSSIFFDRGQEVAVTVIANDRRDDSLPASDDVTVENTRPEFVFLQIVPQDPTRSDDLTLDFEIDDPDYLDFGLHTLDCQWEMQNGAVWLDIPGATNDVFENCATSGLCDAGDTIRADCYPVDSVERGVRFRTEGVTIRNVPPTLESCTVTPENPTERDDLIANASGVSETEGDTLTVSYEWRVDGVVIPQHTGAVYPWQDTRGHTTMEVICQVSDGFDTVRVSAGQFDIIDVRDADPVVNDTGDSGTTDTGNDCAVTFTLDALSWGNEIGFSVIDADSNVVYTALPGDFTAFSTTTFDLDLNPGDYTIELTDSFGDGWHGGTLTVTDGNGTASVFGADFLDGSLQVEDATFLCEPELCDMTVVMAAGSYGYEMSFDLVDADGNVVYTGDGYTSNLTSSETVELEAGTYSLELVDSFGDGWNGGELTITDGSGIAAVDAVTLLSGSTETLTDIELTCGDGTTDTSDTGSFGGPDDTAATCTITADLYTGSYGYEMGWTVSTLDGTEIYSVASGTYASFSDVVDSFDVAPGDYKIELTDTFGDGWNGATITLTDEAGNVAMDAESFTTGSSETFALTFSCEEVVDTDTDTDTDTDAGSVDCPEGQAVNCYGDCADLSTWGDGTCNNEWGDCSDALHDFGDCTEWGLDSCSVTVNVTTASFGNEVGWSLQAPNGAEIFGIDTGAYQSSTAYSFDIDVVEGDYVFVAEDSAGNGWGNGFFEIIGFDGSVVAAGTLEDGFEEAFTFSEDCGTEPELPTDLACELDVTIDLGSFPQEVGWLLTNEFGVGLGGVTSGTYTSGTESATTTIEVGQGGDFELQLFDSFGDGWNGGTYTITDPAGNILAVGTLEDGTIGSRNFTYLCDETLATGTTDSDACPEGEVEDCNGDCYPEAWLGDEWCDDGSFYSWGSPDFFCAAFDLDEGDCAVNIDDTSAVFVYDTANGCEIDLTYFSTIWGQEVSWDLYDQNGGLIGGAATGDYPSAGLTTTTLAVNPGTLTLVMYDSFGDGWNGGSLNITDVNGDTLTTATLESNGPTLGDGPEYAYFDVDCAEDTAPEVLDTSVLDGDCDVEIEVFEGTWGAELTFDLIDGNGDVVFNFGPYSNFTFLLYTYGVELADGDYTIAMSDSYGDGWNGGYVTVTHPNGTVLVDEATIFSGATGSAEFSLECAAVDTAPFEPEDTADYVFDTAGGCEVTWDLTTSIWASEIGWTIEDSTGSPVFESFANDYDSDSVYGGVLGLNPGTYTVTLTDDFGDGWNGAALTMTDSDGSTLMLDAVTLETGSETTFTVTTECPAVPDTSTPVDTFDSATVDTAPDGCDVDFELFGGSFGTEVSWAVLDEFGNQVFFGDGYTSNATFSGAFSVPSGLYTVEMYDSWGDGWNGASLTMTDINGNLLADGQTFTSGSVADFSITVDCAVDTSVGVDTDTDTDCTVDVVTDGGSFASEVSWTLTDALGTVVASGDGFSGAATITAPAGTYTLNMVDSWGDGWNGATVTIDGVVYGTGFTSGTDATESVTIDCGGTTDTSGGGGVDTDTDCTVDVVTDGGSFASEVSWTLTDALGTVVASGDGFSGAATITAPAGTYTLNMVDSWGDGWNGATVTIDGVVYGTGFTFGTDATESVTIDCGGTTDTSGGGGVDTDTDCTVDVVTDGGSFASEVSWTLTDALGTVVASGDGFSGAATITAPAGTYTLNMVDSWGDGWNGATVTIDGVVYGTGFTFGTDATESVTIDCGGTTDTSGGGGVDTDTDCTVDVVTDGGSFASEVSWTLTDALGTVVASGDGFSGAATITAPAGTYTLNMVDSWGDGWNGATVTIDGVAYGTGFTFGTDATESVTIDCGGTTDTGGGGGVDTDTDCTVDVVTDGGSFASEVSWTLTDALGTVVASGDGFSGAATITAPAGTYTLNMVDSWGDGWNGATVTIDGVVYGTGFTFGTDATESVTIDCGGTTDTGGGGGVDTDTDCTVDVETDGGTFAGEVSWTLTDALGTVVASGDGFSGAATITAPAGTYTLNMVDSWGDGWNGATVTIDGVVYGTGFTFGTDATESVTIDCGGTTDTGSGDTAPVVECDVDYSAGGGSFQNEVSWDLLDGSGNVVLSGIAPDAGVVTLAAGTYTLNMADSWGDGWNGNVVTIEGVDYGTGFTSGSVFSESVTIDCSGTTDTGFGGGDTADTASTDTDTGPGFVYDTANGCAVDYTLDASNWGNEIGWNVYDANGNLVAGVPTGTYSTGDVATGSINVNPGTYTFEMLDSFGDGWNGSDVTLTDLNGSVIANQQTFTSGNSAEFTFDVDCVVETGLFGGETADTAADTDVYVGECEMTLTIETGSFGSEVGFELYDNAGVLVASAQAGDYASFTTYTIAVPAINGRYQMHMFDSWGDGWNGGTYTITNSYDQDVATGTLEDGDFDYDNVRYECEPDATCDVMTIEIETQFYGYEIGFTVTDDNGNIVASAAPGDLLNYNTEVYTIEDTEPQRFYIDMEDTYGDGWNGATWTARDSLGREIKSGTLDAGFSGSDQWRLSCDEVCPEGEIEDCFGNCYPAAWVGDSTCDDGSAQPWGSPAFDCTRFNDDGGDCLIDTADTDVYDGLDTGDGCPDGFEADCNGECWPFEWIGDGHCDDGTEYSWGAPDFDCGTYDRDEGDCIACGLTVQVQTAQYGGEVGWELQTAGGAVLAASPAGAYSSYSTYTTTVSMVPDDFTFVMSDSWGDGWNGGEFTIFNTNGDVVASGTLDDGLSDSVDFYADCEIDTAPVVDTAPEPVTCDVSIVMTTGNYGSEVSWNLEDAGGLVVASGGGYGSFTAYTSTATVAAGETYTVEMVDSWGDGWNGGIIELFDSDGSLAGSGAMATGDREVFDVVFNCLEDTAAGDTDTGTFGGGDTADTDAGGITDTDVTDGDCFFNFALVEDTFGTEQTWTLSDSVGVVATYGPYSNFNNASFSYDIELIDGETYTLDLADSWGDGWDSGNLTVTHADGTFLFDFASFDDGSSASQVFVANCTDSSTWEPPTDTGSFGGGDTAATADCTVDVVTDGGSFASEVSWTLTDALGTVVASGDGFSGAATITAPAGTYTLNMVDSWGDGWNGATVTIDGVAYGTGFTFGTDATESVTIDCGGTTDTGGGGGVDTDTDCTVDVVTDGGSFASEVSWTLTDALGTVVASGDGFSGAATITAPAGTYTLNMVDSWGDGWNGATVTIDGVAYGTGFTFGTDATESVTIDCGGTTDTGGGGGVVAPAGDSALLDGDEFDGDCLATIDITLDNWGSEMAWTITDSVGVEWMQGGLASPYPNFTPGLFQTVSVDLPEGDLTLNITDSYGDGGGDVAISHGGGVTVGVSAGPTTTVPFTVACPVP